MRLVVLLAACVSCTYEFDSYTPNGKADAATGDTATGGCSEAGNRTYGGHCYFPTTAPLSWQDAKKACEAAGAHLAVVTASNEQAAIESMASGSDRWIGLSRPAGSASDVKLFTWVTGEAPNYFKWDVGEPTGAGECGRMKRGGAWGDSSCAAQIVAICEREKL
jgi:hypothetical protein